MPICIHFSSETSAWRYLLPALFNFSESTFSWEVCRFPQGFIDADKALLRDNVFSAVNPGCERYVVEWLERYGTPPTDLEVYWWGTEESPIEGMPFIQLPRLQGDHNAFLLHLKSLYPLRSLSSLVSERSLDPLHRITLRKFLTPKLTAALSKQLAAASLLPPASDKQDLSIIDGEQSAARPELVENTQSQPVKRSTVFDEDDEMETIAEPSQPVIPVQAQQPPTQGGDDDDIQDSGGYSVVDVYENFASDEVKTTENEHFPHWSIAFTDNQHLPVLAHIDQYGCITEAEVIRMLGNARLARGFTTQLDTYSRSLPFDVKVQPSLSGNRYIKSNS
ncbi:MAG: hypothetical protein ACEQSC_00045 [Candidatus Nanopelagicaceae bacterium]